MIKKIGLGFIALIIAAGIYYFTVGSAQITQEMKTQINNQLSSLEKEGFGIENRKIEEEKEHFVISFDDTKKISSFLFSQGIQINAEDASMLKGLKLGVDTHYLPDVYSSVAFDIYPVTLPEVLNTPNSNNDKKVLADINKMLKKKSFLIHIALNKTANAFKGHMKDINETVNEHDLPINLQLKSLHFTGELKDNHIHTIEQSLDNFTIFAKDEMHIVLSDITSDYTVTGKTLYDYRTHYKVDNIVANLKSDVDVNIKGIDVISNSTVDKNTASGGIKMTIADTHISNQPNPYDLKNFVFEIKGSNVDITAMDQLQKSDLSDEKVANAFLKKIFSKGVHFEISELSLESMVNNGQKIDGFDVNAQVTLDKNFDVLALEKNPLSALQTVDADLKLVFSKKLFELIAQQPQAMMALMMFQPKDENNKKVYSLELKDGKLLINGKPAM
ncbi:MAG: YdgA family protein [Sulfurovum sp.]|nr:YdgA family protein [Sulfurovum sp.]